MKIHLIKSNELTTISDQIESCTKIITKANRSIKISKEEFSNLQNETYKDLFVQIIKPALEDINSNFSIDDLNNYALNIIKIAEYITLNHSDLVVKVGTHQKSIGNIEKQKLSLRQNCRKAVQKLGTNYRFTGNIQIPILLAVFSSVISFNKAISINNATKWLLGSIQFKAHTI